MSDVPKFRFGVIGLGMGASHAEALQRWQELARRDAQLAARVQAWGFDD